MCCKIRGLQKLKVPLIVIMFKIYLYNAFENASQTRLKTRTQTYVSFYSL